VEEDSEEEVEEEKEEVDLGNDPDD